jgi:hypothetical protein
MRPDLDEQQINAIDQFGILTEEIVNRRANEGDSCAPQYSLLLSLFSSHLRLWPT